MKKTILFISVVALSFVFAVSAFAASRCVSQGGTAGCYTSIQNAVDDSSPGDIINVLVGRYNEHVAISTNNLTIQGVIASGGRTFVGSGNTTFVLADPAKVVVDAYDGCEPGFNISGTNVAILNLTVRHSCDCNIVSHASNTTLDNLRLINGACGASIYGSNTTVKNSSIMSNGPGPALFAEGDNVAVTNNTVLNNAGGTIVLGSGSQVKNNKITAVGDAVILDDGDSQPAGISEQQIPFLSEGACLTVGYGGNIVVESNTIANCTSSGILVLPSEGVKLSTNTVSGALFGIVLESYGPRVLRNTVKGTFAGIVGMSSNSSVKEIMDSITSGTLSQTVEKHASSYRQLLSTLNGGPSSIYDGNTVTDTMIVGYVIEDYAPSIINNKAISVPSTFLGMFCDYLIWAESGSISGNYASHSSNGFTIWTYNAAISNNISEYNTIFGFHITSDAGTISGNTARYNGGAEKWAGGFAIEAGSGVTISGNKASSNQLGFDICSDGSGNTFTGNSSIFNNWEGVTFRCGGSLSVINNTVNDNSGEGIANGSDGNVSLFTGNTAFRNRTDICNEGGTLPVPAPGNTFGTYDPSNCDLL
jgi:parallel beta-helix repeat protein